MIGASKKTLFYIEFLFKNIFILQEVPAALLLFALDNYQINMMKNINK